MVTGDHDQPTHTDPWLGPDFDPLLLNPTRLLIMSELVTDSYYRFGYLCRAVGAQPSVMSRQVARLRKAGYVRTTRGAYACMWVQRTPLGFQRFHDHVTTLCAVIDTGKQAGEAAHDDADPPVQPATAATSQQHTSTKTEATT